MVNLWSNLIICVQECVDHNLLIPYQPKSDKKGELVAAFKYTALVRAEQTERITSHPLPYVHSAYTYVFVKTCNQLLSHESCRVIDPELVALLA
jgi:hypothetical protein